MKLSTLEIIRMMWRWREWRVDEVRPMMITNGTIWMFGDSRKSQWRFLSGGVTAFTATTSPMNVLWSADGLWPYWITRPFFHRLIRKLKQNQR